MYNKYRKWQSTNVVLPDILRKLTSTLQSTDVSFYYLCSCLSTQFLYRTVAKATFNVKDNIKDIIKNSITLTINITTSPTIIRIIGGKTTSAYYHFLYLPIYNIFKLKTSEQNKFLKKFLVLLLKIISIMIYFNKLIDICINRQESRKSCR